MIIVSLMDGTKAAINDQLITHLIKIVSEDKEGKALNATQVNFGEAGEPGLYVQDSIKNLLQKIEDARAMRDFHGTNGSSARGR
jgi:hypothetical protein